MGWGSEQTGMTVYARDAGLFFTWDGAGWERKIAAGPLGEGDTDAPVSSTATTYINALTTSVDVFEGDRTLLVIATGPSVGNSNGITELGLFRDSVALTEWSQPGKTGVVASYEMPRPLNMIGFDNPGPGTYNYTLQFRVTADFLGTSVLDASAGALLAINVIEV